MKEQVTPVDWSWPVRLDAFDKTPGLSAAEHSFLMADPAVHVNYSEPRLPALAPVQRLIEPLENVFSFIQVTRYKRGQLLSLLLKEMGQRQISFWGWKDEDWLAVVDTHRYFTGWLIAAAYFLCDFRALYVFPKRSHIFSSLARHVFGAERLKSASTQVQEELAVLGYKQRTCRLVPLTIAHLLLSVKSPRFEDLSINTFLAMPKHNNNVAADNCLVAVSRVLTVRGILEKPLSRVAKPCYADEPMALLGNVPAEWARVARYWYEHSTATKKVRLSRYYQILAVGRWLTARHPDIQSPEQWTSAIVANAVVMIKEEKVGEWSHFQSPRIINFGKPYSAGTRITRLTSLRIFFQDLQQWEIIQRRFDPYRAFRSPRSLSSQLERNPRVLADDLWAKLMWAGMNVVQEDLLGQGGRGGRFHTYPFLFVKAVAMIWLFAGLRWNEIRRLRLSCIRWQTDPAGNCVCLLSVPVNKTSSAFTKPIDNLAGEAVEAWEKDRPVQGKLLDSKTGEQVDYLFLFRQHQMGVSYLNHVLIPALCKKAGVPEVDVRGRITGHRARSTIASQLFNSREPMTLFELQQWLGHKHPSSTEHYIKISPTKLMNSYAKAGYFERNMRAIEVLIDQDIIRKGTADKDSWKCFDLGHGYCTYDFFDQCPHRMACAQCSFYMPKQSSRAQMLEAKSNLLRLRQEIPLAKRNWLLLMTDSRLMESFLLT